MYISWRELNMTLSFEMLHKTTTIYTGSKNDFYITDDIGITKKQHGNNESEKF